MTDQEAIDYAGYLFYENRILDAQKVIAAQLKASPENHVLLYNFAVLKSNLGDFDLCTENCERALSICPDFNEARDLLAHQRLRDGNWREGMELFEARFLKPFAIPFFKFPFPVWNGTAEFGRRLLLWCEQGLGDSVQFARLIAPVRAAGFYVTLLARDELVDLFRDSEIADEVLPFGEIVRIRENADGTSAYFFNAGYFQNKSFDAHLPLMSLGRIINVNPLNPTGPFPFLKVSDARKNQAAEILGSKKKPRVGLVWSGSSSNVHEFRLINGRRCLPLAELKQLLEDDSFEFISLQKDRAAFARHEYPVIRAPGLTNSFADTAAIISNLDCLVTIDTSVCHVAGGLGVPVFLLNRFDSCWRWLKNREDSPWYPTLRIFRQTNPGDWRSAVGPLIGQLKSSFVAKRFNGYASFIEKFREAAR